LGGKEFNDPLLPPLMPGYGAPDLYGKNLASRPKRKRPQPQLQYEVTTYRPRFNPLINNAGNKKIIPPQHPYAYNNHNDQQPQQGQVAGGKDDFKFHSLPIKKSLTFLQAAGRNTPGFNELPYGPTVPSRLPTQSEISYLEPIARPRPSNSNNNNKQVKFPMDNPVQQHPKRSPAIVEDRGMLSSPSTPRPRIEASSPREQQQQNKKPLGAFSIAVFNKNGGNYNIKNAKNNVRFPNFNRGLNEQGINFFPLNQQRRMATSNRRSDLEGLPRRRVASASRKRFLRRKG
jgi:hypothetical protein